MATAVALVYQLIRLVLTGDAGSDFVNTLLNTIQLLFLFVVVLVYHLNVLRADGASMADALAEKQRAFSVLVVDSGEGVVDSVKAALAKSGAKVQVTVTTPDKKPEGDFKAIILSGSLATDAPAWVRSFGGSRIIVENEANGLVWADDAAQAAESVQKLAEGQEIQKKRPSRSAWMIVIYVFAALFAFQLLFLLLAFGISLVTGF
jgi:cell division protein FtsI/penicillin-binding protein 2